MVLGFGLSSFWPSLSLRQDNDLRLDFQIFCLGSFFDTPVTLIEGMSDAVSDQPTKKRARYTPDNHPLIIFTGLLSYNGP